MTYTLLWDLWWAAETGHVSTSPPPRDGEHTLLHLGLYHTWRRNLGTWLASLLLSSQWSLQGVLGLRLGGKKCPLDPNLFLYRSLPLIWMTHTHTPLGPSVPSGPRPSAFIRDWLRTFTLYGDKPETSYPPGDLSHNKTEIILDFITEAQTPPPRQCSPRLREVLHG